MEDYTISKEILSSFNLTKGKPVTLLMTNTKDKIKVFDNDKIKVTL